MSQHRESGCLNGESGSVDADSGSEDGEDDELKAPKNNFTKFYHSHENTNYS